MNPPPPLSGYRNKTDEEQLKLLSMFHYLRAALGFAGIFFIGFSYFFFRNVFLNSSIWHGPKAPPFQMFEMMKYIFLLSAIWSLISVCLNILSGLFIHRKKYRMFSLIVAGIDCLQMPLGTILGVFTIIILVRDSVRESYTS